jgi:DNA-binding response OmpR family regulator
MVTWKTNVDTAHTVLIVSDQPELVATWTALFSQRNCIVLAEFKVADAIQSAHLVSPTLVLVDIDMPKEKRSSFLKGLRSVCRAPILMLITANTVDEILEANRSGADECFVKPVNPAVLVVKAMAWLGHGHRVEKASPPVSITL